MISFNHIPQYLCVILILILIAFAANPGGEPPSGFAQEGLPFMKKYCFSCHTGDEPAAELALNAFSDDLSLIENRDVWDRVLDMVGTGYMPPAESEHQPTMEESDTFVAQIEAILNMQTVRRNRIQGE